MRYILNTCRKEGTLTLSLLHLPFTSATAWIPCHTENLIPAADLPGVTESRRHSSTPTPAPSPKLISLEAYISKYFLREQHWERPGRYLSNTEVQGRLPGERNSHGRCSRMSRVSQATKQRKAFIIRGPETGRYLMWAGLWLRCWEKPEAN